MAVTVCIPAHNEADIIAATIASASGLPSVKQVLVIDDGSTDDTAAAALVAGATVLRSICNRGKGAALGSAALVLELISAGSAQHTQHKLTAEQLKLEGTALTPVAGSDIILLLDADLGDSAQAATSLLEPVCADQADMSIAVFPTLTSRSGFGLVLRTARIAIADLGNGFQAQAPLSGQRAMTWSCFKKLQPFAARYGVEVAMTVTALRAGCRIVEVPVVMRHRATGRNISGFIHRGRQYLDVRRAIRHLKRTS